MNRQPPANYARNGRRNFILGVLYLLLAVLVVRAAWLQLVSDRYLQEQGKARYLRSVKIVATRGMVLDRNEKPLAISTPVDSVWINPTEFEIDQDRWQELEKALSITADELTQGLEKYAGKEFMYVKRQLSPQEAAAIQDLDLKGVYLQREYKRYYPTGMVTAHVIGITNLEGQGQEGVELRFNAHLSGEDGKKIILRDLYGRAVENVERLKDVREGKNLQLSIDSRIQYLAYRELKKAVLEHRAEGGSAVVLSARSGEILAMVNEPVFNPNNRRSLGKNNLRNRAVTDVFEPGSTIKPFTMALALQNGIVGPDSKIDTNPGYLPIGRYTIHDTRNYGMLTASRVLVKSSNVGTAKIALQMPAEELWSLLSRVGFGQSTDIGFPGETSGNLRARQRWPRIDHATLSYGYGLSATTLQLARAYMVLANNGYLVPVSLLTRQDKPIQTRVLPEKIVGQIRQMLFMAASKQGTAPLAQVAQYTVAGKTGTVHLSEKGGYAEDRYASVFAGFAPASDPQLVMAVMINEPGEDRYYGGQVAAPVFSRVMAGALRLLNIPPDKILSAPKAAARQATRKGVAG